MGTADNPISRSSAAARRILIIRLSAIGDIIMASGLIPVLRSSYPSAYIAWLTEDSNRDLLRHNPRLDRVIVWPRSRWRKLWRDRHFLLLAREFRELRRELQAQRFDLVLDLQGLLKSGVWAWLARGRERVGLGSREGSQWLMTRVIDRNVNDPRIGKEYRELARRLQWDAGDYAMDIAVAPENEERAAALLTAAGIEGGFAVLCPFTTRPQKHWFVERWGSLAEALARETGLVSVLLGGPGDLAHAEAIRRSGTDGSMVDLTGKTGLADCAAIIRRSRLVIGVDTGLTHLGIACGRPTIALFGSTRPYLDTGDGKGRVLYEPLPCSPCRRRPTCHGAFHCMALHTAEDVCAQARRLLLSGAG